MKKIYKKKKGFFALLLVIIIFSLLPTFLLASSLQANWPKSPTGRELTLETELHEFIAYLYEWGIALGGLAVFVVLVLAGFQYLTSAGDPGKMADAISRIKSAAIGLILLLASWLILSIINPELTTLKPVDWEWQYEELAGLHLDLDDLTGAPCDYVVLYKNREWSGGSEDFHFAENQTLIEVQEEGWQSGKSFIKLTDEEKQNIEEGYLTVQRYDDRGNKNPHGDYKEGGICLADLYYTTGMWWWKAVCGGLMGRIQFPSRDFRESIFYEKKITCFEITRILPDSD